LSSILPDDFSGLIFAPSEEYSVYVLLGLLWRHLPFQIALESFGSDSVSHRYGHTNWPYAKGKLFKDGKWKEVFIEIKLQSSGFRSSFSRHPGGGVDLLICWEHNAPDVEKHIGDLIELRRIFWKLPVEERNQLIWKPDITAKMPGYDPSISLLIRKFSPDGQKKVQAMVDYWESVVAGKSELKFFTGKTVAVRVYKYAKESLLILSRFSDKLPGIAERYNGKQSKEGFRVPLKPLSTEDIISILKSVRRLARRI